VNGFTRGRIYSALAGRNSAAGGNMVGERGGIVADAGQEGGTHFRQKRQAEEIQPRHAGDAGAVDGFAAASRTVISIQRKSTPRCLSR